MIELVAAGATKVREESYDGEHLGHTVMLDPGGQRVLRGVSSHASGLNSASTFGSCSNRENVPAPAISCAA